MQKTSSGLLHSTPTTFIFRPITSPFSIKTVGRSNFFFKFIKQHLRVKTFWGNTENAVRIQIYTTISTYCLAAIIEHALHLNRNVNEVLRILGSSMLTKDALTLDYFSEYSQMDSKNIAVCIHD